MKTLSMKSLALLSICAAVPASSACNLAGAKKCQKKNKEKPNILFIMGDDLTSQAISAYGGILSSVFKTPNMDRVAAEGVKLNNCFVTNSISAPSRATIMTGQYSQNNGVYTLADELDYRHPTVSKYMQKAGYYTGIVGKWHLKTEPQGFDYYCVFPGFGHYFDPEMITKGEWGSDPSLHKKHGKVYKGHSTDVVEKKVEEFLDGRDKSKPFMLMCDFKAPHRNWEYAPRFEHIFDGIEMPEPDNLLDTYKTKGAYANKLTNKMEDFLYEDLRVKKPEGMTKAEERHWAYQIYIKNYLRCVAGIDENVGKILKYLDDNNLTDKTIVIITGDQGFFLGEHGFFDKRLMYEESLKMPFLVRYPKEIKAGTENSDFVLNIDFAPTFMDYAGLKRPIDMQGESFRQNLAGHTPSDWRQSMYYRYWLNIGWGHDVTAHYGIRTKRYKLIYYYGLPLGMLGAKERPYTPDWELYDLKNDPEEMNNIYNDHKNDKLIKNLKEQLLQLKCKYNDMDLHYPQMVKLDKEYFWKKN